MGYVVAPENNGVLVRAAWPIALPGLLPPAPAAVQQHADLVRDIVARFGEDAVHARPFWPMLKQHYGFHSVAATRKYVMLCNREADLAARVLTPSRVLFNDLRAVQVLVGARATGHVSLRSALHVGYLEYRFFHDSGIEPNRSSTATGPLNKLRDSVGSSDWLRSHMENALPLVEALYGPQRAPHKNLYFEYIDLVGDNFAEFEEYNYFSQLDQFLVRALQEEVKSFGSEEQLAIRETGARGHLKRYASIVQSEVGVKPSVWVPAIPKNRAGKLNSIAAHATRTLASRIGYRLLASKELLHDLV